MSRRDELIRILERARFIYHQTPDHVRMTDHEYDKLEAELRALDPSYVIPVGAPVPFASKVKHAIPMGSQGKATSVPEFEKWWDTTGRAALVADLKGDGLSISLRYEAGHFVQALTRGDGSEGQDITNNAIEFNGVPVSCSYGSEPFTGYVRGEAVLPVEEWDEIDPDHESNPRNLACGIAVRTDGENAEKLAFRAFDVHTDQADFETELDKRHFLETLGFTHLGVGAVRANQLTPARDIYDGTRTDRPTLPHWIDGVVFKVNDLAAQRKLGVTDGCPKGQVAWKFPSEEATTTLEDIVLSVGHTGKIVPTAKFKDVRLGGVTVGSASLHNWDEIKRLNIAVGDTITVIRAGDVIPAVVGVVHRGHSRRHVAPPTTCPICGAPAQKHINTGGDQSVDIFCDNAVCPGRAAGRIKSYIRKRDIQGLGEEVLRALMEHRETACEAHVTCIADLYKLRTAVPGGLGLCSLKVNGRNLGEKRANSILAEIEKSRTCTIDQFLGSLGVKHLGRRRVHLIRQAWITRRGGNMVPGLALPNVLNTLHRWFTCPNLGSLLVSQACSLGIPGTARAIQDDLDSRKDEIVSLAVFMNFIPDEKPAPARAAGGPLVGQVVCVTGSLSQPRKAVHEAILAAGGQICDDVTNKTTILVQADPSSVSSKSHKAQKLQVKVISESALQQMISGEAA